ncbi:MAG: RDD family protein [Nanoarchaeota archaeon]
MKKSTLNYLLEKPEVSIWKRGFAFLIDILIIQFIVNFSFRSQIEKQISNGNLIEVYNLINQNYILYQPFILKLSIVTALLSLIYFTLLEWKLNQTLGKMLLKIKVMPKRLKFWQALVRNLSKSTFFINYTSFIFLVDLFYLGFTKQRLFDKLAKTSLAKVKLK